MTEKELNEIWKLVKKVIENYNLNYYAAVTIGGQFGKLTTEIKKLQEKIEYLEDRDEELSKLEAYGVDNWSGYSDALRDSENIFEED